MRAGIPKVITPCIGVCSTALGDDVCRGCKRFSHEVIDWNSYSEEQKQFIDRRLDEFLVRVTANRLRIVNQDVLSWQLGVQQINYLRHKDPYIWLFQLLRAGAAQINDCGLFGFERRGGDADVSLLAVREAIDQEFYILSQAHYQRYIGMYIKKST
ncbi:MAG: DUF1289 domain-containing protein [Spongiibacteraceae bacterium]